MIAMERMLWLAAMSESGLTHSFRCKMGAEEVDWVIGSHKVHGHPSSKAR